MATKKARRKIKPQPKGKPRRPGRPGVTVQLPKSVNTAQRLLRDLQEGTMVPEDLSVAQRRACVALTLDQNLSSEALGRLFRVSGKTIRQDVAWIRREVGQTVMEWDLTTLVGDLAMAKEECVRGARAKEDHGLMWTIHKEFASTLISMGVVKKEAANDSFEILIKGVGGRYEGAVAAVAGRLDPLLTGEVQPTGFPGGKAKAEPVVTSQEEGIKLPFLDVSPHGPSRVVTSQPQGPRITQDQWPELEPEGD